MTTPATTIHDAVGTVDLALRSAVRVYLMLDAADTGEGRRLFDQASQDIARLETALEALVGKDVARPWSEYVWALARHRASEAVA